MKKVALLSDGWKRLIVYAWVEGIMNKAGECEEEVCLYQFNCYGNWSRDSRHNQGEYNIFNLPDLKQYDGIILDCNNIVDKKVLKYVIELIRKSGVPAVTISYDIDGFYYAGIDNRKPIIDMMEHLYYEHDCRSFVFAGGPEDNYENSLRTQAFLECIDEFGLLRSNNPVIYGDYDFDSGVNVFKRMNEENRAIPDAIVCASDNIAAGICAEAEKAGYSIPENFRVTGFDNLDKAAYFKPQITTVDHKRENIGYRCLEILLELWEGKTPVKYNFVPSKCQFTESCGCPNNGQVDYREHMKNQILYGIRKGYEDESLSDLEGEMSKCDNYDDIYECMGEFLMQHSCEGFYVVADVALMEAKSEVSFSTEGYNHNNMSVVYAYENGKRLNMAAEDELFRYIEKHGSRSEYMFTPIHFKQYTVGYSVLKNGNFLYNNPYFYDMHNVLVKEMEELYSHQKLENINKRLWDIYNKDQLTGLYNRIAFSETLAPAFKQYYERNIVCAIGFIDVDDFKMINDTYGHDYGDDVLRKVAAILQKNCPQGGYVCRYGGDEFVIFFPSPDKEKAEKVKQAINEDTADIRLKLSIGMVLSEADKGGNIMDYFEIADKNMYKEKLEHKTNRRS